jgi:hypothetical protein
MKTVKRSDIRLKIPEIQLIHNRKSKLVNMVLYELGIEMLYGK